jgi:transcriptional regulator with XRE-family HTH domain
MLLHMATDRRRDPVLTKFGVTVRGARERTGKRLVELATELEISEYHLRAIETGRDRASNAVYWRLANALGVDPAPVLKDVDVS